MADSDSKILLQDYRTWKKCKNEFNVIIINQIEHQRMILAKNPLFDPYSCFQRLDRDSKGYIQTSDFRNFLKDFSFKLDENCLSDLLNLYDTDRDMALKYQEWVSIISFI